MRKYRIFTSDLGFGIYKKFVTEDDKITQMWFLDGKGNWTLKKDYARTFYHRVDAEGALTILRIKGRTEETSEDQDEQKEKSEKQSWSEL